MSPSSFSSAPRLTMAYSFLKDVGEAALRQTAVQRHLAAFKAAHHAVAGDGLGALGAAAGVLAAAGSHTAGRCAVFRASGPSGA